MSAKNHLSRRDFLKVSVGLTGLSLAACVAPAAPAPVAAPPAAEAPKAAEAKPTEAPQPTAKPAEAEAIVVNIDFRNYGPDASGKNPKQGQALAAILAKYHELHPNVTIKHNPIDAGAWQDIQQWTERRLVAKDGPDLMFGNWTYLAEKWVEAGLMGFWDDYLEMPNPYVKGVNHWKDQFIMPSERQSNGKTTWLGLDNTTLWYFYNKDMFKEMGLQEPKMWPDLMDMAKKIKDNGVIPWADYHSLAYAVWTFDPAADQILFKIFEEIAKGEKREPLPKWVAQAVVDKKYGITSPEYQDSFKIATDWWQYAPEGAFSGGDDQGYQLFLSGKAATRFGGVWENANLVADMPKAQKPFQWGTFPIPVIPKSMSKYATEKQTAAVFIAGYMLFMLPAYNSGKKRDATADFLMYASMPENLGSLLAENQGLVPNIKNVPLPEGLANFRVDEDATFWYINSWGDTHINTQVRDAWVRNWQLVLLKQMTVEDFTKTMQQQLEEAANQELAKT